MVFRDSLDDKITDYIPSPSEVAEPVLYLFSFCKKFFHNCVPDSLQLGVELLHIKLQLPVREQTLSLIFRQLTVVSEKKR